MSAEAVPASGFQTASPTGVSNGAANHLGAVIEVWDGAQYSVTHCPNIIGDGNALGRAVSAGSWAFNNINWDRSRNNIDVVGLASAARTATTTLPDITTYDATGLIVVLDMTLVGTGSVTVTINYKDPASGKYILLLSGAAITSNSTNKYVIHPSITAVANVSAQTLLGRVIQIVVTANNANAATYSLGYTLMRN